PTAQLIAKLRQALPAHFAQLQFFFQPADIVDQVLNFGQPAPIDVRISGPDQTEAFSLASKIARDLTKVAGVVDSHVFQVPNAPALTVDLDRALATLTGVTQQEAANNVLVATNSSAQSAPNFWVDPRNSVSYPLVVQVPTYSFASSQDLQTMPVTSGGGQVDTMRESYTGLFTGIALAIILVYLFLVMNFQSWIDPLIVLMAVPFAL